MVMIAARTSSAGAARRYLNLSLCRRLYSSDDDRPWTYLRNSQNGAEVFLVGTCHVSAESANTVKEVIRAVKPNAVAIELCKGRAEKLRSGITETISPTDFLKLSGHEFLPHILRSLYGMLRSFGLNPGEEFIVAMQEGEVVGAKIHCIDQEQHVTLEKVRKEISFLNVTSFLADLPQVANKYPAFYEAVSLGDHQRSIDALTKRGVMIETMQMYENYFPGAVKALLHERNELMIKQLRKLEGKVVGVVGLAHLHGMQKLWQDAEP